MNSFRRKIDTAVRDFIQGYPLDADSLIARLKNVGLAIDWEDDVKRCDEDHDANLIRGTIDQVLVELDELTSAELIDPDTRERVKAVSLDEVREAVEEVWSDGE